MTTLDRVLQAFPDSNVATVTEIAQSTGLSRLEARRIMRKLYKRGYLDRLNSATYHRLIARSPSDRHVLGT
jgi:predicted transcriptional regulator of viral defense system